MTTLSKGERRRKQLYDAAARLFARKGYHATSLRDLAQALGLQKSSLYHYMDSKEDLLYHLLDDYITLALGQLEAIGTQASPPSQKLADFMRFYASFYAGDQDRLILLVNEQGSLGRRHREEMKAKQRRYLAVLKGILAELAAAGIMKDIPLTVAAFAFFGMVHYTYHWYQPQGPVDPSRLGEYFLSIFVSGILEPPGEDQP